jgi:hypothetical protein
VTVPDYQSLMLPVLRSVADGKEHRLADVRTVLAEQIGLTDEDLALKIPSGAPVFNSRVHWAVTYLAQAGLLRRPRRGVVELTDRGNEVLAEAPASVDNSLLARYPEFLEFKMRAREGQQDAAAAELTPGPLASSKGTPREQLADAVEEANAAVAAELLNRIRDREPAFLEQLVLRLLTAMDYGGKGGRSRAPRMIWRSGTRWRHTTGRAGSGSCLRTGQEVRRRTLRRAARDPSLRRSVARGAGGSRRLHRYKSFHRRGERLRRASAGAPSAHRRRTSYRADGPAQRRRPRGTDFHAQARGRRLLRVGLIQIPSPRSTHVFEIVDQAVTTRRVPWRSCSSAVSVVGRR